MGIIIIIYIGYGCQLVFKYGFYKGKSLHMIWVGGNKVANGWQVQEFFFGLEKGATTCNGFFNE